MWCTHALVGFFQVCSFMTLHHHMKENSLTKMNRRCMTLHHHMFHWYFRGIRNYMNCCYHLYQYYSHKSNFHWKNKETWINVVSLKNNFYILCVYSHIRIWGRVWFAFSNTSFNCIISTRVCQITKIIIILLNLVVHKFITALIMFSSILLKKKISIDYW